MLSRIGAIYRDLLFFIKFALFIQVFLLIEGGELRCDSMENDFEVFH